MLTVADTVVFSGGRVFFPFDFRAAELAACNAAPESAGAFRLHVEGRVIGAAGDAVLVHRVILIFQSGAGIQRNVCLLEMPAICAEGAAGKKILIKRSRVKGGIAQEGVRVDKGMGGKKIL